MSFLHFYCRGCGEGKLALETTCNVCEEGYCNVCAPELTVECRGCGMKVCKECMQDDEYCLECKSSEEIEKQASITAQTGSRHDMNKLAKLEQKRLERKAI